MCISLVLCFGLDVGLVAVCCVFWIKLGLQLDDCVFNFCLFLFFGWLGVF